MTQLNIHMNAKFEKELLKFMKLRGIPTKAEAVRIAIREGLQHTIGYKKVMNFDSWIGLGNKVPTNKKHKFSSDDDLWK